MDRLLLRRVDSPILHIIKELLYGRANHFRPVCMDTDVQSWGAFPLQVLPLFHSDYPFLSLSFTVCSRSPKKRGSAWNPRNEAVTALSNHSLDVLQRIRSSFQRSQVSSAIYHSLSGILECSRPFLLPMEEPKQRCNALAVHSALVLITLFAFNYVFWPNLTSF